MKSDSGWYMDSSSGSSVAFRAYVNSTTATSAVYSEGTSFDRTFNATAGDRIRVYAYGWGAITGSIYLANLTLRVTFIAPYNFIGRYNVLSYSGAYCFQELYKSGIFKNTTLSISSPFTFNSSSYVNYVSVASIITLLSAYMNTAVIDANGATITVDGVSKNITGFSKTSSFLTLYFSSGSPITFYVEEGAINNSVHGGANVAGSFSTYSDIWSVRSKTVIPFIHATSSSTADGTDIGTASKNIRNINMAGNIVGANSISATEVWGAVFN